MISDEAVEAAFRELPDGAGVYVNRDDLREILEAAAPYMLAPMVALANAWEALGERDIADSKTFEDEDIAMAFLTEGANKVEAARHLRNALDDNPYRSRA